MESLKPQPGIYRHFKGKKYSVIGVGRHGQSVGTDGLLEVGRYSEGKDLEVFVYKRGNSFVIEGNIPRDLEFVIYEQLYDSDCGDFKKGAFWVRPLEMFLQAVPADGREVPRFEYIGKDNEQGTG